jgi:hypothetical protein
VTELPIPGVYDIPEDQYHADPVPVGSLSSSGARTLLSACPAVFMHQQLNPVQKREFDFGTAAHKLILGSGPDIGIVDAKDWRAKEAKTKAEKIRAAGAVPLLAHEWQDVQEMAGVLRKHELASALLAPGSGDAEQTLIWQDKATGVWRRARLDWLPASTSGRMVIVDYKTTVSAHPASITKSVANYSYHQQDAWYRDGVRELGLASDVEMVFIFQEKTAPYLVKVVSLDPPAVRVGRDRNRRALELYRDCVAAGEWPDYGSDIAYISLPSWAQKDFS